MYDLRYARDGYSVEAAIRKGRELPDWAKDVPDLEFPETFFLDSFWYLHTERNYELATIPFSKIDEYGIKKGLDDVIRKCFIDIIMMTDIAFINYTTEDSKKKREPDIRVKPK